MKPFHLPYMGRPHRRSVENLSQQNLHLMATFYTLTSDHMGNLAQVISLVRAQCGQTRRKNVGNKNYVWIGGPLNPYPKNLTWWSYASHSPKIKIKIMVKTFRARSQKVRTLQMSVNRVWWQFRRMGDMRSNSVQENNPNCPTPTPKKYEVKINSQKLCSKLQNPKVSTQVWMSVNWFWWQLTGKGVWV